MGNPHNDEIERLTVAVFGTKPDHSDGLVGITGTHSREFYGTENQPGGMVEDVCEIGTKVSDHHITLYGTKDNPGGIAADMRSVKKTVFVGSVFIGACAALLVLIQFLTKVVPVIQNMK